MSPGVSLISEIRLLIFFYNLYVLFFTSIYQPNKLINNKIVSIINIRDKYIL